MEVDTDLSFPPGQCQRQYQSNSVLPFVLLNWPGGLDHTGALLAKNDIEAAYRLIPVHPQDCPLQAIVWEKQVFVVPMLPFGLQSTVKIFNAVADALKWYLCQCGIFHVLHCLDDYNIINPPNSPQ